MDKTFAETQGQPPFDWNKWLDAAIANPDSVTTDEAARVDLLSFKWVTCACGNQCAIIPRKAFSHFESGIGEPLDDLLSSLGASFHAAVGTKDWVGAKDVLQRIEARSAVLIAEQLAVLKANQEGRR